MKNLLKNNDSKLFIEFYSDSIEERRKIISFLLNLGYSKSYYFFEKSAFFKKKYLNLLLNIFSILLFNKSKNKIKLIEIDPNSLIRNNIKSNILFSKKNLV